MKKILLSFFIAFITFENSKAQKNTGFKIGASVAVITPQAGSYIAGGDQNRKFTGVHDDLFVKAVVISNGENMLAIFTVDCIGMLYPQLLQVREEVKKELPAFPVLQVQKYFPPSPLHD